MRLIVPLGAACAVLAGVQGCAQPASTPAASVPAAAPEIIVARDDFGLTASASYPGGCRAALSATGGKALRYRNECEPALAANVGTLRALTAALFGTAGLPAEITQFDAGRLVMTWPEIALRLALAARASPAWDAERARRDDGFANTFVRDVVNRQHIFHELDDLFGRRGREVALTSVEKVLIGAPELTPIAAPLRAHGVGEGERLPFDAQLWFQLRPVAEKGGRT